MKALQAAQMRGQVRRAKYATDHSSCRMLLKTARLAYGPLELYARKFNIGQHIYFEVIRHDDESIVWTGQACCALQARAIALEKLTDEKELDGA